MFVVVRCLLFVFSCSLLFVVCFSFFVVVRCSLFVVRCSSFVVVRCSLFVLLVVVVVVVVGFLSNDGWTTFCSPKMLDSGWSTASTFSAGAPTADLHPARPRSFCEHGPPQRYQVVNKSTSFGPLSSMPCGCLETLEKIEYIS